MRDSELIEVRECSIWDEVWEFYPDLTKSIVFDRTQTRPRTADEAERRKMEKSLRLLKTKIKKPVKKNLV
tara:strand:- start:43 stop:252 length:210 start_codon:yes stop_codon:yes gene_type:complete